ncbi:hypothetical protein ABGN05_20020 [Aquibium sp. LZ166]|uniref:CopG family transcriptional regulator n=1 Tax=Aquibium pacificus TaxID=3153579 RepID=A0ABV3SPT1_9HYPH
MYEPVSHNRVVVQLPDSLLEFLDGECERYALSRSAIVRQSLDLRRTTNRRRAALEDELFTVPAEDLS